MVSLFSIMRTCSRWVLTTLSTPTTGTTNNQSDTCANIPRAVASVARHVHAEERAQSGLGLHGHRSAQLPDLLLGDGETQASTRYVRDLPAGGHARRESQAQELCIVHLVQLLLGMDPFGLHHGTQPLHVDTGSVVRHTQFDVVVLELAHDYGDAAAGRLSQPPPDLWDLDPVVYAVAEDVRQRIFQILDDPLVDLDVGPFDC
jgi:hypothetical protein